MFKFNNVKYFKSNLIKLFSTYKTTTNKKHINPDKDMDIYIKKEKLLKDSADNKVKLKNIEETKCLVIHPVFNIKYYN